MLLGLLLFCAVARANCKAGNTPSQDGTTCEPNANGCAKALTDAGCATCTPAGDDQTCLTCNPGSNKVRPDRKGCIASCPANSNEAGGICTCTAGNTPSQDGTTCEPNANGCAKALTDAGCATCTPAGDDQTCLTCNPGSNKVRPDRKGCIASCPANSNEAGGICTCTAGNTPSQDGTTCEPNANGCAKALTDAGCATCTPAGDDQTCLTCNPGSNKVRPDRKGCIASCPANSNEAGGICTCTAGNTPSQDGTTCEPNANGCAKALTDAGCATCTPAGDDQTCLTCNPGSNKVRPDRKGCIASCPANSNEAGGICTCTAGNTPSQDGTTCEPNANGCAKALTDAGCATCTPAGDDQTCLTCNPGSNKVRPDRKGCIASCPANSNEAGGICTCTAGNTPSQDGTTCEPNANGCAKALTDAGCATCTPAGDDQTCLTCNPGSNKVRPDRKGCIASCPANSNEAGGICTCTAGNTPSQDGTTCEPNANGCAKALTDAGCATCTPAGDDQTCLTCNPGSNKVRPDRKGCIASCPANSNEAGGICTCTAGNTPSQDGTTCEPNANGCAKALTDAGCATCTPAGDDQTCLTCNPGSNKVRPDRKGCIASCPANSNEAGGICTCTAGNTPSQDGTTCEPNANGCAKALTDAGCATCTPAGDDQTCLTCNPGSNKVRPDRKGCIASCPANSNEAGGICTCTAGNTPSQDGTTCEPNANGCAKALTDAGCATCTPAGDDQTCLTCNPGSNKVRPDRKGCIASCPANSNEAGGICTCTAGNTPSQDGTTCVSETACNTPNCKACDNPKTDREVCTECNDKSYLTPTNQCVSDCTAISGYYGDTDRKCKACSPECAECVGPANNQCSACPAGKALIYKSSDPMQGGTCGDACTADKNGCKVCGARIGGTDYCSQCSVDNQAPLNGVCTTSNARVAFCTEMNNGACTKCAANYFLKEGGCYETTKQPGKQICTLADSKGECETCANGLQPNNGACPSCHSTCKTCSTADSSDKCTSCAAGYYMVGSAAGPCTSCDSNSGSVKGVAGCMSCAPPSNNQGSVLCYLMNGDSAGGSTNKSGLSTGAIAGIAVAAVIIVGGLVGFLCWWFLCRGKA
ncbi:VSP [Giardia duodenalis]|uniref:VSP n=1 Tax=Giardia intestinalis (strain ATCC 50803 / WB clone C6) TaxID=184922 RepID=A0A644F1H8_GIAIC|nr:VSP [Giardia intestinalis]KAE8302486.1 VSP [Giardia intestinalis]